MDNLPGGQLQGGPSFQQQQQQPQQQQQQQQQLHPGVEMNSGQLPSMPALSDGAQQVKVINSSGVGQQFNSAQSPVPMQPMVRPVQVANNGVMAQNLPPGQPQRPGQAVPVKPPPAEEASTVKKVTRNNLIFKLLRSRDTKSN